jgi:ABC-type oligopeptide transport system ATPase subunit
MVLCSPNVCGVEVLVINRSELGPRHMDVYRHQLSGGRRQRIAIARALSVSACILCRAQHPYSRQLVSAIPRLRRN